MLARRLPAAVDRALGFVKHFFVMDRDQLIDKIVADVAARMEGARTSAALRLDPSELAGRIDCSLLRPEASAAALDKLCHDAVQLGFHGVCVSPSRVAYVSRRLQGTDVKICAAVDFPLGAATSRSKAFEAREAVSDGASEIHMVINISLLKSKDYRAVEEDIRAVRRATRRNKFLTVVLETAFLTPEEKVLSCELSRKAEADFVSTSTGFLGGTATTEDLELMGRVVGKDIRLQANGGIRSYRTALAMIAAGAERIGSAAAARIMAEVLT